MDIFKKIKILYEDKDILAVDKPAGLIVHLDGRTDEPTLVDWLLDRYPGIETVGESFELPDGTFIPRPGIVHRLDRETSGVLLVGKTNEGFDYLKKQFLKRTVKKFYRALVWGTFNEKEGIIDKAIGRSQGDFRRWTAQRGKRGEERDAVTYYWVLGSGHGISYIESMPKTGRTHQIRVHMKSINHPVLCDKLYAPNKECLFGLGRTALHSFSVEFKNLSNEVVKVEAPIPKDMALAIKELAK
jgi:23S rRNA pseudouridine1911/1915/1917 synthase